jgi:hypothetical protein
MAKATTPTITMTDTDSLIPYVNNARTHSQVQINQIASSIKEFGFINPVIIDGDNGIIAGHGRVQAAQKLGMAEVPCVQASHLTEAQKKAYILADNKIALNAGWDDELLSLELQFLKNEYDDLDIFGFAEHEIARVFNKTSTDHDIEQLYTDKIDTPIYEPNNDPIPETLSTLYDDTKTLALYDKIESLNLPPAQTKFLRAAATRMTVFSYSKIADFYAQSTPEVQDIMEQLALVIIDYEKAIELGFVKLSKSLQTLRANEDAT